MAEHDFRKRPISRADVELTQKDPTYLSLGGVQGMADLLLEQEAIIQAFLYASNDLEVTPQLDEKGDPTGYDRVQFWDTENPSFEEIRKRAEELLLG